MLNLSLRQGLLAASLALLLLAPALHHVLRPEISVAASDGDKKAIGAVLFATRGCAHCHGDNGEGTDRGPTLKDAHKKLSADKIHDQIVQGGGGMPAFGSSLTHEETDDLVQFLRARKWMAPPTLPPSAAPQGVPATPSTMPGA